MSQKMPLASPPRRGAGPRRSPERPPAAGLPAPGLPPGLRAGLEALSGLSLQAVRVHHDSTQPAALAAQAFAQGPEIHLAPGQAQQLPHEAWHVVQQAQGRVAAPASGPQRDASLEAEADLMGALASSGPLAPARGMRQPSWPQPPGVDAPIQLRDLRLGKQRIGNLPAAKRNKEFTEALAPYIKVHGAKRVEALASQLFSASGEDFADLTQFLIELAYDLETKSTPDQPLTLQEHFMTEYGWKRAANAPRPKLPDKQQLKLYRTMSVADWKKLDQGDHSVLVGGHIGDFKQALKYFLGKSADAKVMVEFQLQPGAELRLFGPRLALPATDERTPKLKTMAKAMGNADFPLCNTAEGTSPSAIGIKSESEGEAGFSIGIGGGDTATKFMALVEQAVLRSVGTEVSRLPDKGSPVEAEAQLLLGVNNCLINAVAMAALGRTATLEELIAIRGALNNYGEMLLASPLVIDAIRDALQIDNAITVMYEGLTPPEDFDGTGAPLMVYHVGGNHFTHTAPD